MRDRAQSHGIHLPDKPPREIVIPYKEREIRELIRQKDPELYTRVEKEHKSGALERKRIDYTTQIQKEIETKNRDYGIKNTPKDYTKMTGNKQSVYTPTKQVDTREKKTPYIQPEQKSTSRIQKREKEQKTMKNIPSSKYDDDERQKIEKKATSNKSNSNRYVEKEKDAYQNKRGEPSQSQREKQTVDKREKMNKPSSKKMR